MLLVILFNSVAPAYIIMLSVFEGSPLLLTDTRKIASSILKPGQLTVVSHELISWPRVDATPDVAGQILHHRISPGECRMASWVRSPLPEQHLEQELDEQELDTVRLLQKGNRQASDPPLRNGDIELPEILHVSEAQLPQSYQEIKTLLWIENSVIHKKALEEWERKLKLLTARVERKRKLGWNQRNEIYNLVGFFSVFQGVLLTAVSQSNLLHCNNWWSPFILSVLASLVTFVGVWQKFSYIWSLDKTISSEENTLKAVVKRINDLRREGKDFRFANVKEKRREEPSRFTVYTFLVFAALASFAVVFAVSHPIILCHSGCVPDTTCPSRPT